MEKALTGACIIGQSGGPTSVINASAYGVIRTALDAECITNVYGAAHGIKGVGEGGAIAPAGAIVNAINDALKDLGATLCEIPATPERVLAALAEARRANNGRSAA